MHKKRVDIKTLNATKHENPGDTELRLEILLQSIFQRVRNNIPKQAFFSNLYSESPMELPNLKKLRANEYAENSHIEAWMSFTNELPGKIQANYSCTTHVRMHVAPVFSKNSTCSVGIGTPPFK